jgi:isoamylase/glycogen operon protein
LRVSSNLKLGINAVELLPIFKFDETRNYWGYNPTHFFAPQNGYAVKNPIEEFKTMVRELHRNGIEVILDVVYNHTDEKHMAEKVYYMVDEKGNYIDFTGCHNTLNVNHPVVQKLVLDSLHYWAEEMGVDGFRFDLAAVFPTCLIEAISKNFPHKKLIAEPWDAAGKYQLGRFFPWSEWDDKYRDGIRRFIKGTGGWPVSPSHNIHFVTAHDGYTLRDLVSYQQKHNEANGEGNRDGSNHNESWNCGVEGPTNDPAICALRERQMRNFWVALLTTKGIPQILIEDVYGHTRKGNNNPYNQDNELNWFLWDHLEPKMFRFISSLISLRKDLSKLHAHFNNTHVPSQISVPEGRWRIAVLTAEDWEFHEEGDDVQKVTLAPYSSVLLYSKF